MSEMSAMSDMRREERDEKNNEARRKDKDNGRKHTHRQITVANAASNKEYGSHPEKKKR